MNYIMINILYMISAFILNVFCMYFCYNLLGKKINLNNKKNIIILITMTAISPILNYYCPQPYKLIISILFLIAIGYIITDKQLINAILIIVLMEIDLIISEMFFIGAISFIADYHSTLIVSSSNIINSLIAYLILRTKIPNKLYTQLIKITSTMHNKEIATYSIMVISILVISIIESYMNIPLSIVLVTNTVMGLILVSIIVKFVTAKSNYQLISNKYQTSINSLKEYETMIDKFKVNTHENKNELMTIRNMIKNKDKNIVEYIDALVDNKIKDNEKIMYQTSKIPEGGLRATIYSKLCVMDKYKIKYKLDIAKNVRTVDLINLDEEIILNICKILGVFMDNAIEEVRNLKKKEIRIELYVIENKLYIDITNNFKGNIDINKMGHERNTSKGEEHGYGLLLVNKIIKENSKYLENEKNINGNYFTQTLKIKIKDYTD